MSPDFCGQACQDRWSASRASRAAIVHAPTDAGTRLGVHDSESNIWVLPKVSAVRPCPA